jgi:hypothetical protein
MRSLSLYALAVLLTAGGCRSAQPTTLLFRPRATGPPPLAVARPDSTPAAPPTPAVLPRLAQSRRQQHSPPAARAKLPRWPTALLFSKRQPASSARPRVLTTYRRPDHTTRDYTPLVLAVLLAALAILLLSASVIGLSGSYIPLVGVLILLLAGVVYFHWRHSG